ncbi:hypothetical protein ACFLSV_04310 [Bacteroidota bacterium]
MDSNWMVMELNWMVMDSNWMVMGNYRMAIEINRISIKNHTECQFFNNNKHNLLILPSGKTPDGTKKIKFS